MSSHNYFQPLSPDVSPDRSPSGVTDDSQPDRDVGHTILQYREWVPASERSQESLDHHNNEILERWNRAIRTNLCKWCAKLDLESLRFGPKPLDWKPFKVADYALATDAKYYFGWPRKERSFHITQGQTGSQVFSMPMKPGCPLCRILRNICREIKPDSDEFVADFHLKEPIPMCLRDCDKSENWSTVDIVVTIGSVRRTLTIVPLIQSTDMEQPTRHNCMAKQALRPTADFKQLAGWIKECDEEHHHEGLIGVSGRKLPSVRFIDVKNRCIVEKSLKNNFAALSYTWGKRQQFQLSKERLKDLQKPQSLIEVWDDLSKVVTDAIAACERLDIPYLWIDTLCIVDDDPDEKHNQIASMDLIYSLAYITLIAAAGDDAYGGLPRVSKDLVRKIRTIKIDDLDYHLENTSDWGNNEVDKSTWCTRGWTFQELVLSRRVLVFTSTEVFFYCSRGFQAESMHRLSGSSYESRFGASVLRMCNSVKPQPPGLATYSIQSVRNNYETVHWNLLNNYLGRQLSYDSDILVAFSGVLNAEGATIGTSYWGLPCKILARALFWELNNISIIYPGQHCFKSSEFTMVRREGFPSWSWTGWKISKNQMFSSEKKRPMLRNLIETDNFTPFVHIFSVEYGEVTSLMGERSETDGVEGFDPAQIERFNHQMSDCKQLLQPDTRVIPNADYYQSLSPHCLIFLASCSTFIVSRKPEVRDQDHAFGLYKVFTEDKKRHNNSSYPRVWLNIEWREQQAGGLDFVLLGMDVDEARFDGKAYYTMLIKHQGSVAERIAIPQPFTLNQWQYGDPKMQWIKLG